MQLSERVCCLWAAEGARQGKQILAQIRGDGLEATSAMFEAGVTSSEDTDNISSMESSTSSPVMETHDSEGHAVAGGEEAAAAWPGVAARPVSAAVAATAGSR